MLGLIRRAGAAGRPSGRTGTAPDVGRIPGARRSLPEVEGSGMSGTRSRARAEVRMSSEPWRTRREKGSTGTFSAPKLREFGSKPAKSPSVTPPSLETLGSGKFGSP